MKGKGEKRDIEKPNEKELMKMIAEMWKIIFDHFLPMLPKINGGGA